MLCNSLLQLVSLALATSVFMDCDTIEEEGADHQNSSQSPSLSTVGASIDNWTTINGARLRYVSLGSGPHPLLLIPGALGTAETHYRYQLDYFAREGSGFQVVSFDPRGYGASRSVERLRNECFATDAKDGYELMLHLSLPVFSVLGWCNGGAAGLILASMFPQSVRKLVVFGTRSYITNEEIEFYEVIRDIGTWPIGKLNANFLDPFLEVYGSSLQTMWSEWLDTINDYYSKNNGDICTKILSSVTRPTLILHGAQDKFCLPFHGEYLRDHVTGSRLVVMEHGKHMLHFKHHQEFNAIVDDFLSSQ